MSILKDRIRPLDPSSLQRFLGPDAGKTSFQLASRGGHVRDVTGTVAYLDEDAQTYMVLGGDGELLRVPLRDITSAREKAMGDRSSSDHDVEGLGTTR